MKTCLFFYRFISFCAIFSLCLSMHAEKSSQKPLIVVYENTTDNPHANLLKTLLQKYQYDYVFLGEGQTWKGFGQICKNLHRYLKTIDPERMVLKLDSRDMLPMRHANAFHKALHQLIESGKWSGNNVLIGRENWPANGVRSMNYYYPGEIFDQTGKKLSASPTPYWRYTLRLLNRISMFSPRSYWISAVTLPRDDAWASHTKHAFLNGGWYLAKASTLIELFDRIAATNTDDVQHLFNDYWLSHPNMFTIDNERALIYHTTPFKKLPGKWVAGTWQHEHGLAPFFVHFPQKNYEAYWETYHQSLKQSQKNANTKRI